MKQLPRHMLMYLSQKHDHTIFPVGLGANIDLLKLYRVNIKRQISGRWWWQLPIQYLWNASIYIPELKKYQSNIVTMRSILSIYKEKHLRCLISQHKNERYRKHKASIQHRLKISVFIIPMEGRSTVSYSVNKQVLIYYLPIPCWSQSKACAYQRNVHLAK